MNERIRELMKQAGGNPNYRAFRGYFLPPPPDYIDPATVDIKKFAELIVRECGNYMNSRVPGNIEVSATVAKMKQHLGVEQ